MAATEARYPEQNGENALINAVVVVVVGILATTLSQPQVLGRLPIQNLLKNELHVNRAANAAFFFWIGLAWYFKPLVGIVTDAFPFLGSRRKSYILVSTLLATLSWAGLWFTPHQYNKLLWVCIVLDFFMVVMSTVVGAYMVEIAQAISGSGRLTAVREVVMQASLLVAGPAAGYLGSIAFGWTAAACGGITFLLVPAALFFLYEQRKRVKTREMLENAGKQLVNIGKANAMWAASGLMALFYLAPGLSTAIFYKQQNDLHMGTEAQGFLQLLSGLFGVVAALMYAYACKRVNLRRLLLICIVFGTAANLGYLLYSSVDRARVVESFNGFGYTLCELALMDLAVRATPAGSEGFGFSLMMSVRNLALFGTDWFGSMLLDRYHWQFNTLVLANALTTAITIPLVFLLPKMLVSKKDAEAPEELAVPRMVMQE